jgi:hypothetical protein
MRDQFHQWTGRKGTGAAAAAGPQPGGGQ